jgi:polysaccharide deacetylase 2 family uncharacterized protein YibQ
MAALTFVTTRTANRNSHTVTKSTNDAIGAGVVAVVIDNTKTKYEVDRALKATLRAIARQMGKVVTVDDIPTTGATTE